MSTLGRLSAAMRRRVLAEEPTCRCGAPSEEVDHVIPRYLGGTDARENLRGLCKTCHAAKTEAEFGPRSAFAETDRKRKAAGTKPPHALRGANPGDEDPCPICGYYEDICDCALTVGDDGEGFPDIDDSVFSARHPVKDGVLVWY